MDRNAQKRTLGGSSPIELGQRKNLCCSQRKNLVVRAHGNVRLSPTMECIFEYPFVRMPSLCPWIAACKYYALQRKTQTERQMRETVGWRAFTRGKCIFPRSDAFTAAPGVGAGVAAAREPGGAGSFRASSTLSPRRPESRSRRRRPAHHHSRETSTRTVCI